MSPTAPSTRRAAAIAERFMDAFNREGVDAAELMLTPDVRMHSAPEWTGRAVYEGREGARELAAEWTDNFAEYQWVPEQSRDLGDGRAVLLGQHGGRTRAGVPIEGKVAGLFKIDGDQVCEIRFFFTWEEALAAAGLER